MRTEPSRHAVTVTERARTTLLAALAVLSLGPAPARATEILRVTNRFDAACGVGATVAPLADVTGDGQPDVLVGAVDPERSGCLGAAIVYDPAADRLVWQRSFRTDEHDSARRSLVPLRGDLDGDGCEDVVAGPPFVRVDPSRPAPSGRENSILVLSGRTGETLARLSSRVAGEWFGSVVAPAGDVDGDGTPDLLVGDPDYVNQLGVSMAAVLVVSSRDGSEIARFPAPRAGERFGAALAAAGDVDGDGSADFLIGAPNAAMPNAPLTGAVDVVSGREGTAIARLFGAEGESIGAAVALAGDVDGDGRPEVLAAGPDGAVRLLALGGLTLRALGARGDGPVAIAAGEDATGDGAPDAILGRSAAGGVAVVSLRDGSAVFAFEALDISAGRSPSALGASVAFLPDLDGDGAAEVLAGAPRAAAPRLRDTTGAIVIASHENEIALRSGNVNRGAGPAADVLWVNDSVGDGRREIELLRHVPVTILMAAPPAATSRAPFALFARIGRPGRADLDPIDGTGIACIPMPLGHAAPGTRVIASGLPAGTLHESAPGPMRPTEPAPAIVTHLPAGLRREIVLALQGAIVDPASASGPLSLTNAVIVISR